LPSLLQALIVFDHGDADATIAVFAKGSTGDKETSASSIMRRQKSMLSCP